MIFLDKYIVARRDSRSVAKLISNVGRSVIDSRLRHGS